MSHGPRRVFVGIDWATQSHQVTVLDEQGGPLGEKSVQHTAQALSQMCEWLISLSGCGEPQGVHVAIEVPHGAVVETLLERGFSVFSINPRQLDRFRDRYSMSGAKDDRRDALVLADSLRTDVRCFRRIQASSEEIVILREWSRMHDGLTTEHGRLASQLREQLLRYYPQFLQAVDDPSETWALALWDKFPSPSKVTARSRGTIGKVLKQHRIRKVTAQEVLDVLHQPALKVAEGTEKAARAHIELIVERLRVVQRHLKECDRQLEVQVEQLAKGTPSSESRCEQRDAAIVLSLPGVGPVVSATLLAEAAQPLKERSYQALRTLCGVAPVTRRSGKGRPIVEMRYACNPRLRRAAYHWARVASLKDERCKAKYTALRQRGHSHARSLRSVADRLLKVLTSMLRSQTTYRSSAA